MKLFEDDIKPISNCNQSGNNWDIFDPSVYTPDSSKFRADYIKSITAKVTAELDASLLSEEAPAGSEPSADLQVTGRDPEKHLKFILKYLRGPRGFNGSIDNFVVLSESEYERLRVKDPNKFYFTYEGEGGNPGYVENNVLVVLNDSIENQILVTTSGQINNYILTL